MKIKFLGLVMLASVSASSTSVFAHSYKRTQTYHRSSSSMNMMKRPVERQPIWRSSPNFLSEPDPSKWGGGGGGGGGGAGAGGGM